MKTSSLSDRWTSEAHRLWRTIPPDKQELILGKVHCTHCPHPVTMIEFWGREVQGDLILTGICATCDGKVARVIETGDPMSPHLAPILLKRKISTVLIELELDELWIILETLLQHGRPDLVFQYLEQLYRKDILNRREMEILAKHYDIEPPL